MISRCCAAPFHDAPAGGRLRQSGAEARQPSGETEMRRSVATTEGLAATEEQRKGNLPLVPWGCRGIIAFCCISSRIANSRADARLFVIPTRFERVTHSLEGCCSIQLSYGTKRDCKDNKKSGFPMAQGKSEVGNHSQHYNQHGVGLVAQGGIQNPGVPAGRVDAL